MSFLPHTPDEVSSPGPVRARVVALRPIAEGEELCFSCVVVVRRRRRRIAFLLTRSLADWPRDSVSHQAMAITMAHRRAEMVNVMVV